MNKSAPCWWGLYVYMNFLPPEEMFLKRGEIIISSQHQHNFPSDFLARKVQNNLKFDIEDIFFCRCLYGEWWWYVVCASQG